MSKRADYEEKATELILPIVEQNGFELVDVEYVKEGSDNYLRAYIDKPGGIMIEDCEIVSRAFSDLLDEKDFISESYILEVSSPGLGRPFRKDKDFQRNIGEEVEFKLFSPVNRKKDYVGILKAFDSETITIEFENGEESQFERKNLAIIRQTVYF
ncbi:MAG: ribosome maturation factor RimP [Butyrivibrio sp.]|nr:ribosome maturation factor RimP [Butyrivibrio sp.]